MLTLFFYVCICIAEVNKKKKKKKQYKIYKIYTRYKINNKKKSF